MKKFENILLKYIILLLSVAMFIIPISGCAVTEAETVISFWTIFPEGDPYRDNMETLLADFEEKNPGIKVDHLGISFWDYQGKLRTAQAGGTDPDVCLNDNFNVQLRAKDEVIQSIDTFADQYSLSIDDFSEADVDVFSYEGNLYALPFSSDYRLLYYNKDHFREVGLNPDNPPTTIVQLVEYAEKLDQRDSAGNLVRCGFSPKLGNNSFYTDVWNTGGEFFLPDGTPNFDSPEVVYGIQQYVDLCNRYSTREFNSFSTMAEASGIDPFLTGMASMEVSGDWLAWEMAEYVEDGIIEEFDWGVIAYPSTDGNRASYGGGFSLELSARSDPQHAEAGFKLMQYLTSYEVQINWREYFRFTPVNMRALDSLKENATQNEQIIYAESKYRKFPNLCEAVPEWWTVVTPEIDVALLGKQTVEQAMVNANVALTNQIKISESGKSVAVLDVWLIIGLMALIAVTVCICTIVKKEG